MFETQKFETLDDLLTEQIEDLYDAEKRLVNVLPKMHDAATDPKLKDAFKAHLDETNNQIKRLEEVFQHLEMKPTREACDAMKGILSEGQEMLNAEGDPTVKDAALIASAQRIEHYEMAGYGTCCALAKRVGRDDIAKILHETLEEEKAADAKLTEIATESVNAAAPAN
jgi:ferritin-like metal-binding protein YciE